MRTTTYLALILLTAGCGVEPVVLMDTPVIYHEDGIDPLAHLEKPQRTTSHSIFYATTRQRRLDSLFEPLAYGNTPATTLQVGKARVSFGRDLLWEVLHNESKSAIRLNEIVMDLTDVWEHGRLAFENGQYKQGELDGADEYFAEINQQLALAKDPEILLYVHGAKVNFYNACVYAAELDHFAGRDMIGIAFAWPTRQNIFTYAWGDDVLRAQQSAHSLASFLRLLATRTTARKINIICWSAGGRLVSRALAELFGQEERLTEDPAAIRLGLVVFAAPDVPVHDFVERLPAIDRIAERAIITASDDDTALTTATVLMGRGQRMGTSSEDLPEEERIALKLATHVELVDVSRGKEERGFDITGHRYWYSHPWVASDIILCVRTHLSARERGLEPSEIENVWYLPKDYPERVRAAAKKALGSSW